MPVIIDIEDIDRIFVTRFLHIRPTIVTHALREYLDGYFGKARLIKQEDRIVIIVKVMSVPVCWFVIKALWH